MRIDAKRIVLAGYQAILSGPAGGVVGFALTTSAALRDDEKRRRTDANNRF